jgi:cytochrome c-type biogenesis protein CcmH
MIWMIGSAISIVASVYVSGWLFARGRLNWRTAWIPATALCAAPIFGLSLATFDAPATAMGSHAGSAGAIAWPATSARAATPARPAASAAGVSAAPIGSLVAGLEARLKASPEDAAGWTLLAQTYAFLGQQAQVEQAVARAVALGVDEAQLRARIQQAAHASSGVTSTPAG